MAETTKIEWTDATFNPVIGCARVSPGCDHCYAEALMRRYGKPELWQGERRRTTPANWKKPLAWNREAAREGKRTRVFCASLADVFDNGWEKEWRDDLWALIRATPRLDWQLLTKRPQNISRMLPLDWDNGWPNVWLGCTAENQEEADRRIPHLLRIPARIRFLSCEPLLEHTQPYGLTMHLDEFGNHRSGAGIHWVICGGESGQRKRSMNLEWARSLRDQCAKSGVPYFFKQIDKVQPIPPDLMVRQFPASAP